jgi:hypothetical protein
MTQPDPKPPTVPLPTVDELADLERLLRAARHERKLYGYPGSPAVLLMDRQLDALLSAARLTLDVRAFLEEHHRALWAALTFQDCDSFEEREVRDRTQQALSALLARVKEG